MDIVCCTKVVKANLLFVILGYINLDFHFLTHEMIGTMCLLPAYALAYVRSTDAELFLRFNVLYKLCNNLFFAVWLS